VKTDSLDCKVQLVFLGVDKVPPDLQAHQVLEAFPGLLDHQEKMVMMVFLD
jgi:hypothetical protein